MTEPKETDFQGADRWAHRSLERWRSATAVATGAMLVILAWAPTKELLQPWREYQRHYNAVAEAHGFAPIALRIRQIWIPTAERADRCGSCHLGASGETALAGAPPFEAHPPVPHDPETYGCTYCHSGQGRATVASDAHGDGGRWAYPILSPERTEAGCGACHSGILLPLPEDTEDAGTLVEDLGCSQCHENPGSGTPAIDSTAMKGVPEDWVRRHDGLISSEGSPPLSEVDALDLETLNAWLRTRVGAPRLARGKMVFHQLGCMGCHRRGDVGGDVGPDLSQIGDRDVREFAPKGESDSETLPEWLRQHLLTPQELVQDSRMPPVDVEEMERESDIDDLVTYLLSLRGELVPADLTPPDRARVLFRLGRDFPASGRGLFVSFCSSCHGGLGEGREMETLGMVTPMVGTRGVLATVTPRYFRDSILRGRRGRYMPAWGPDDGGLSSREIDAVVDYLASRGFQAPSFESIAGPADAAKGRLVFEERCAFCHSAANGGPGFGNDLSTGATLRHFSDRVLLGAITRGWVEEGMPAFAFLPTTELRDLIAYLRLAGPTARGELLTADGLHAHAGRQLWLAKCGACHGAEGEGGEGPMLNTGPYLEWAEDGYLARRIRNHLGARARAEIGRPSNEDLEAILDSMRRWSGRVSPAPPPAPDPDAVARGRELYPERCAECHGGDGRGRTGTALANADFLALVSRPFLVMTILEGRKGTPMVAWREQQERPVSLQDAFDLADYILSLRRTGSESPSPVSVEPQSRKNKEG